MTDDDFAPSLAAVVEMLQTAPVPEAPEVLPRAMYAFRSRRRGCRRGLSRHGLRLTTVVGVTAISGCLAAGYAAALPDPVQRVAHHLLGHVGLPAPRRTADSSPRPASPTLHRQLREQPAPGDVRSTATRSTGVRVLLTTSGRDLSAGSRLSISAIRLGRAVPMEIQVSWRPDASWRTLKHCSAATRCSTTLTPARSEWIRARAGELATSPRHVTVVPVLRTTWGPAATSSGRRLHVATRGLRRGETLFLEGARHGQARWEERVRVDSHGVAEFTVPRLQAATPLRISASANEFHGAVSVMVPAAPTRSPA